MPYLIDGHNLIPKVAGLSLGAVDDEQQLIEMLQTFCQRQRQRKQVEVFFDNAPPGGVRAQNFGLVIARFVRQGRTADQAIRERLERLGRTARNWTVVSSDRAVQASARACRAASLSSEAFAMALQQVLDDQHKDRGKMEQVSLKPDEVQEWLELFGEEQTGEEFG